MAAGCGTVPSALHLVNGASTTLQAAVLSVKTHLSCFVQQSQRTAAPGSIAGKDLAMLGPESQPTPLAALWTCLNIMKETYGCAGNHCTITQ